MTSFILFVVTSVIFWLASWGISSIPDLNAVIAVFSGCVVGFVTVFIVRGRE